MRILNQLVSDLRPIAGFNFKRHGEKDIIIRPEDAMAHLRLVSTYANCGLTVEHKKISGIDVHIIKAEDVTEDVLTKLAVLAETARKVDNAQRQSSFRQRRSHVSEEPATSHRTSSIRGLISGQKLNLPEDLRETILDPANNKPGEKSIAPKENLAAILFTACKASFEDPSKPAAFYIQQAFAGNRTEQLKAAIASRSGIEEKRGRAVDQILRESLRVLSNMIGNGFRNPSGPRQSR